MTDKEQIKSLVESIEKLTNGLEMEIAGVLVNFLEETGLVVDSVTVEKQITNDYWVDVKLSHPSWIQNINRFRKIWK